jgi:hypothetical protein
LICSQLGQIQDGADGIIGLACNLHTRSPLYLIFLVRIVGYILDYF